MSEWVSLAAAPFVTVSATGLAEGGLPNGGANFGPDTPETLTSGIQEALNLLATTGGTVHCKQGAYLVSAPLAFTGSNQLLYFEPGSSLTFANGIIGSVPSWFDPGDYYPASHHRLIHMGSSLTSESVFSHQWFVGNGLQLNWGNNSSPTLNNGIMINVPGQSSSPEYSGPGGQDYLIQDIVCTGEIFCTIIVMAENLSTGAAPVTLSETQRTRNITLDRVTATYSSDTNANGTSVILIRCSSDVLVSHCYVDCHSLPSSIDYDPINITGHTGEVAGVEVVRSYFRANGESGQCLEIQGGVMGTTTTNTVGMHDVRFVQCTFDSGATSGAPVAGEGGAFIDDNDSTSAIAQLWNIEFYQCLWVNAGVTVQSFSPTISVGASPFTYTNGTPFPQEVTVSGGTVSSITVGGVSVPVSSPNHVLVRPGVAVVVTYTGAPTMTWNAFGYLRFNGALPSGIVPSSVFLQARGPNDPGPQPAVGTSPYTFQNTDASVEIVIVHGGTVSAISLNSVATGRTTGDFWLSPGDTLTVTYTAAPTVNVQAR